MENFLVYNTTTGAVAFRGSGPEGTAILQQLNEDLAVMIVTPAIWASDPLDLEGVKTLFMAKIDVVSDNVRGTVITNTPSQITAYMEKEAEARRIVAGDMSNLAYLPLEAAAVGKDLQTLATEVVAKADECRLINARIEAARVGAKAQLVVAENLAEIAQAVTVDWDAVVNLEPVE